MRHRPAFIFVTVLITGALSACDQVLTGDEGECNPIVDLVGPSMQAADRALSCAPTVTFEGREYELWCAPVRPRLLLEEPLLAGETRDVNWRARLISGVPAGEAIAVKTVAQAHDDERQGDCERWGFAPLLAVDDHVAYTHLERVGIPGTFRIPKDGRIDG